MVYAGDWWSVHAGHELAAIAARAGRAGGRAVKFGMVAPCDQLLARLEHAMRSTCWQRLKRDWY
jgi:hypothetical protein